ncbi:hypothetical protein JL722_12188 [Aureococcus anophagefferens]|nr:hypothetical protein JL722_12188 [Aureococcus anophagefferens]
MPAYHSKYAGAETGDEACGCALLPLKTKTRGPAPLMADGEEDIVDEVIKYYRPNSLFRNFEVKGAPASAPPRGRSRAGTRPSHGTPSFVAGADRSLIYLTLSMQQFLKECERFKRRGLRAVIKQFPIPGGPGWSLGGMFPTPGDIQEGESWRLYMKQAREELSLRTLDVLFYSDGSKNKWWASFPSASSWARSSRRA